MAHTIGVVCSRGVGPERGGRERNEDNYLICRDEKVAYLDGAEERVEPAGGVGSLLAVCDGMGGHDDGHVASTAAARVMAKLFRPGVPRDPPRALLKYIQESHRRLYWKARDKGPVTMGTTLTVAWLLDSRLAWAHVGDSRMYLFRNDRLRQLTRDQTRDEFANRDGRPTMPDGEKLAQSFIYGSRGLGDNTSLRLEQGRDSGSEVLFAGDKLLLCTDGLCGSVDDASLAEVLRHIHDPQAAAVSCMERAIARGSTDNITVMVVRVDETSNGLGDDDEWDDDDEEATCLF